MNLARLYHTIRPLRWQQLWYRAWFPLLKACYRPVKITPGLVHPATQFPRVDFYTLPSSDIFDPRDNAYHLLNIRRSFPGNTDWNEVQHGLLWAYHLNYFNWLANEDIPVAARLKTMQDYAGARVKIGLDAYPVSLRGINWICFLLKHDIREPVLDEVLFSHYHRLYRFPEYHIQANHLWENGCSLVWAGHYFNNTRFYQKGSAILLKALEEQIPEDGGHIEGSPMYHSLLLYRLLQTLELLSASPHFPGNSLRETIHNTASRMLGWLASITFNDGSWPMFNDTTNFMAPITRQLMTMAGHLSVPVNETVPGGYKMVRRKDWEMIVDIADIKPAYQPGHAHADAFTFCLNVGGRPVIVDTGISTYENSTKRWQERSTAAHNTLTVNGHNSSDVWKSFRVRRRAKVTIVENTASGLEIKHDGYRNLNVLVSRSLSWNNNQILLKDRITGGDDNCGILNLHIHPELIIENLGKNHFKTGPLQFHVENALEVIILDYDFCDGFNKTRAAQKLSIKMKGELNIKFHIQDVTC